MRCNYHEMTQEEIQTTLTRLLKAGPIRLSDLVLPTVNDNLRKVAKSRTGTDFEVEWFAVNEAVWSLVARRLAWIEIDQAHPMAWFIQLTERGKAAAESKAFNPEDSTGYMRRLVQDSPATSAAVQLYLRESLKSFEQECYLASAVLLGVAAEACMLETADAFVNWSGEPAAKLRRMLENPRTFYLAKLEGFQKCLAVTKGSLPMDLSDNLDLDVTAVLQLIRLTRNDAGRPTGRRINREDAFNHLVLYARANKRLYDLVGFFKDETSRGESIAAA
jgi:hypothetical protein